MVLGTKNLGVMGMGSENWHFLFLAAPAGEAWVLLGSHGLQPWAALATNWPCCWRCDTLQCRWVCKQLAFFDRATG